MRAVTEIITHTPLWVWPLLAWLIWQGVQALQQRTQPLWRSLIVPAVFFFMGLRRLLVAHDGALAPLLWFGAALAFGALAWTHGPRVIAVDRARGLATRPGSAVPLLRNVLVFLLQYAVAATAAMHLDPNGFGTLASYAVSGATSGYFAGWAAALILHYRQAAPAAAPSV
jgi:hypothetical protein